ncbi:MAG: SURF1 family protein [Actinomycetota bacterium]
MRRFIAVTTFAIVLIYGCAQGALWQFDRYQVRHANNELIRKNVSLPSIPEELMEKLPQSKIAFRKVSLSGNFEPDKEILIRNRYHQGKYGFGVLTLFVSEAGKKYWVDRGWVIAGKDAKTPPEVVPVTNQSLEITGYARVENIESQVRGSVIALPGKASSQLQGWDVQQAIQTQPIYFDLISVSIPSFNPAVPTSLPELSDGPHLAYSFQWALFIFLVAFAWYLVIREDRTNQPAKL